MRNNKDPRPIMGFLEFVEKHKGHLDNVLLQHRGDDRVHQYHCPCGYYWAGEEMDLGIEIRSSEKPK